MGLSNRYDEGWSPQKVAIIWIGAILTVAVVAAMIVILTIRYNEQSVTRWQACLDSGASALECKSAVYGR